MYIIDLRHEIFMSQKNQEKVKCIFLFREERNKKTNTFYILIYIFT